MGGDGPDLAGWPRAAPLGPLPGGDGGVSDSGVAREARGQVISRLQECLAALVHFRSKEFTLDEIISAT